MFFVPLAALTDPASGPAAIAAAVGVREEGGQPLLDRLAAHLASKHLLLVIDNWEHLLEGAPLLGELLRAAPGLTVLATSRAPLHLQAEREYPVPPLALPRRKPPPTLEQLSQYEAVRLFIARAQAVKPDFAVDNENAAGGGGDLSSPRWAAAGHRAGRGAYSALAAAGAAHAVGASVAQS